jgi:hypothetical protein
MEKQLKKGPYGVVLFDNNTLGVIPVKWIFEEDKSLFCYWSSSRQRVVALKDANPNWTVCAIKKICGRTGNAVSIVKTFFLSSYCTKL